MEDKRDKIGLVVKNSKKLPGSCVPIMEFSSVITFATFRQN